MSKQVLVSKGSAFVTEVPSPTIDRGEILVAVQVSCLSIGTEMSGVRSSSVPIWKRAMKQPEKISETLDIAISQGFTRAWKMVVDKKNEANPTGYSAAGIVLAVGADIKDVLPGDRVACAGAPHAEIIKVPRNLCSLLPAELDWDSASTVTLGAIALQGVRRAQPTLGECFVVIGLGILGQLTIQLLRANGCRVIGVDIDKNRIELAKQFGMNLGIDPSNDSEIDQVARLTDGLGADGVIITAATPSDEVVSTSFKMCRKKGRVVLVGDVGLNLNRRDFYAKEIDFFISTSYGPGRYDHIYEEQGLDYPASYVRWTENRNMVEYLKLLSEGIVKVGPLISAKYDIADTKLAYESLKAGLSKPLMVLLNYPDNILNKASVQFLQPKTHPDSRNKIRIAIIGAGGFTRSTHLPNIYALDKEFILQAVVNRTGHIAKSVAEQFGAVYAATDYEVILNDPDIDAVVIGTRHHLHARMIIESLKAGKHVLVEKPMVLTESELEELNLFIENYSGKSLPVLLTGYNRRFSPYALRIAELLKDKSGPFMINYRMNAGYIPFEHWVHGKEGGGRNLGEACHIYDLFTYFTNAKFTKISAESISPKSRYYQKNDNFIATINFEDGSLASLTYSALGAKDFDKEIADIYFDGKIAVIKDYKQLDLFGLKTKGIKSSIQNKGHFEEIKCFAEAIKTGTWPIPWWQQYQSAKIALEVEKKIFL